MTPRRSSRRLEVYLLAFERVSKARFSLGHYLTFYNERLLYLSLQGRTPDDAYFGKPETAMAS